MSTPQAELQRRAVIRRVLYLFVALMVVVPLLIDLPLPFEPSSDARDLFVKVDQLKPGQHVLLAFDYDPTSREELFPMSLAILRHCFKNDLIPIVMTHWQSGVGLCRQLCEETAAESKTMWGKEKLSGRDFVLLGFKPGYTNLVLNMGESLTGAFDKDYYDQPTEGMAALEGVRSLKDIPLGIDIAAGATVEMWIAYGADRFGFDLGAGCTAVIAPDLYPFLQSKQLVGYLGGLRGAADYEKMLERQVKTEIAARILPKPGDDAPKRSADASRGMQAQSTTHLLIILLIVVANVQFLVRRFRQKREASP